MRVEREPITDANVDAATSGSDISEEEHEVTLHDEEVATETRSVPKPAGGAGRSGGWAQPGTAPPTLFPSSKAP